MPSLSYWAWFLDWAWPAARFSKKPWEACLSASKPPEHLLVASGAALVRPQPECDSFVVIMGSLLSVTLAMEDGRKQMPKIYGMAGRNLGATGFQLFWHVLLPASLPFIVSGLKQGWAFAWRSLITAEMLYLSLGLGQVLMMGRDLNDMSAVIAVMILIIAIGYGCRWRCLQVHGAPLAT